jgi:hypothetical protein
MFATSDPDIDAVVILSGPVGPRGERILAIMCGHLSSAGKNPQLIE